MENIPDDPVIFAGTHQGILDGFIWIEDCPKHAVVVHSAETNKFLLMAQLNTGLVLVTKDKQKSKKRLQSKLDMMSILLKGHSIFIFPETAWDLSPNKIVLPTNWGFVDISKKTRVPIVPVTINYVYDTSQPKERITHIQIKYAKPIYVKENDDIKSKLDEWLESVSTMRWEMIEQQGLCERSSITNYDYINYLKGNLANLKFGKIDVNRERAGIYGANDEFYLFHHINDVPFDDRGNLL